MTEAAPGACPLSLGHFRPVALHGFGDGRNSYSWSIAYFNGHVYVGTNRNTLAVGKMREVTVNTMAAFPVPVPPVPKDRESMLRMVALSQFAQIWRYCPQTLVWQRVYRPPLVRGLDGRLIPQALGFRNMSVFQGRSDPAPALYTIPVCGSLGVAPVVLRSYDGEYFETLPSPNLGDANVLAYRGAVPFKGRLFITPVGFRGGSGSIAHNTTVLCTDDPASGHWMVSNPGGFGNPNNQGIFDMGVCGGYLYAGTINTRQGCEVWKTDGAGPGPHRWTLVLDRGADRGQLNQAIGCFSEFRGNMYAGTGILDAGWNKTQNIGPAAAELLRIYPDDTWDLVVGDPRMTRRGLRIPSSGLGPGFDNGFCGYIWRLRVHDGTLYAGTLDTAVYIPYVERDTWPPTMQRLVDPGLLDHFLRTRGGCELWRSTDGEHWEAVTRNGFGNPFNWGIRALLSTPHGLFVGTANPFGPQVAVRGPAGWRYELNPRGGTEVWHGSLAHAGIDQGGTPETDHLFADLWADGADDMPYTELAARMPSIANSFDLPAGVTEDDPERGHLSLVLTSLAHLKDPPQQQREFAIAEVEADQEREARSNPARRLAMVPPDLSGLAEDLADELRAYFGGPLRNVGYWREEGLSPRRACEQLLIELLALLPAEPAAGPGSVLVVGPNATALEAHLRRIRPAAATAVAPASFHQPEVNRGRGGAAVVKSARSLASAAEPGHHVVLCVEGFAVGDRAAALRQAFHALQPGGWLVGADFLGSSPELEEQLLRDTDSPRLLRALDEELRRAGFAGARLIEATRETWERFYKHSREFFAAKLLLQQIDEDRHTRILHALPGGTLVVAAYVVFAAVRPLVGTDSKEKTDV